MRDFDDYDLDAEAADLGREERRDQRTDAERDDPSARKRGRIYRSRRVRGDFTGPYGIER